MGAAAIGLTLTFAWVVFAIPATILLLRSYGRSRMSGFLWLLVALVAWPLCARVLTMVVGVAGTERLALPAHAAMNFYLLLNIVTTIVGGILLVVALYLLDRQLAERLVAPPAAPPPRSF